MLDYIFVDAANNAEIWYSWYVDHSGEMIYDVFSTTVRVRICMIGGSNTWAADNRGQQLPENLTTLTSGTYGWRYDYAGPFV